MGDECPWRDIEDLTVTIGLTDKYNEAELEVAVQASVSAVSYQLNGFSFPCL